MSIYGDIKEKLPPQKPFKDSGLAERPEPKGRSFRITTYVDCNLGVNCVTRQSRLDFMVFLNELPLYWLSKKQMSYKVSTFGSEFTTM